MSFSLTSYYEISIKDVLAEYSGYFLHADTRSQKEYKEQTKAIYGPYKFYTMQVPTNWVEEKEKNTGLPFYKIKNNKIIEFRPRCYDKRKVNLTDVISSMMENVIENQSRKSVCFHWDVNDGYACKVVYTDEVSKRVRWLGFTDERSLELDFTIEKDGDERITDFIFSSIKLNKNSEHTHSCAYPVEWF